MNEAVLRQAGVDFEQGLARFFNNRQMYETLLSEFVTEFDMDLVRSLLKNGEYEKLYALVHEIKGISGNLSINQVHSASSEFAHHLSIGLYELAEADFIRLENSFSLVSKAIITAGKG